MPLRTLIFRSITLRPVMAAAALLLTTILHAEPIPVRAPQGTTHGFLNIRNESGELQGHGDLTTIVRGNRLTTELTLHFNNGSLDDETSVYTQDRIIRLISDHHIQKGPFFPKPLDQTVEADGQITTRSIDKDGKEKVEIQHIDLPPDTYNGILGAVLLSVPPTAPEFTLGLVVPALGKGRLVKLFIAPESEQPFEITGVRHKATVFRIHIDLGGIVGALAPFVGKKPEDVHVWLIEGSAPELIRVQQQLYDGGPIVSVELAGTTYPH